MQLSPTVTPLDIFVRLLLALFLGGVIGLEREHFHRPAGLRTHTLVSIGSALFTLLSMFMGWWNGDYREPGRIAAQIVSGIGFLGAGTILRQRAGIRGLTTAASLWAVAGIGMACGAGYYLGAALTTLFIFLSLTLLRRMESRPFPLKQERFLVVRCDTQECAQGITDLLKKFDIQVSESTALVKSGKPEMRLLVRVSSDLDYQLFMTKLLEIGVINYEWEEPA